MRRLCISSHSDSVAEWVGYLNDVKCVFWLPKLHDAEQGEGRRLLECA